MEDDKMSHEDPNPPLQVPGGLAYSDPEKAEALADNLVSIPTCTGPTDEDG